MSTNNIFENREYVNDYEHNKYGGKFGEYLKTQEAEVFISMIDPDCQSILDIGSGTGKLSLLMNNDSYTIVSLDSSYEMLNIVKSFINVADFKYLPVVCNAESICFTDRSFDCVVASRLFMHLSDWKAGLAEICRVSKKIIIFDFPSALSSSLIDSIFKRAKKLFITDTICYKTFLISKMLKELKNNDFSLVEIKKEYFFPMLIHRILNKPEFSQKIEYFFKKTGLTNIFGSTIIIKAARNDLKLHI